MFIPNKPADPFPFLPAAVVPCDLTAGGLAALSVGVGVGVGRAATLASEGPGSQGTLNERSVIRWAGPQAASPEAGKCPEVWPWLTSAPGRVSGRTGPGFAQGGHSQTAPLRSGHPLHLSCPCSQRVPAPPAPHRPHATCAPSPPVREPSALRPPAPCAPLDPSPAGARAAPCSPHQAPLARTHGAGAGRRRGLRASGGRPGPRTPDGWQLASPPCPAGSPSSGSQAGRHRQSSTARWEDTGGAFPRGKVRWQ